MKMINQILNKNIKPEPQIGKVTKFKRRTKDQSDIFFLDGINQIYDYIRMLDCEGYPKAFIESHKFKFEFSNAKLTMNNQIQANVRIFKK
jgi:methionyl-tRNA formyltransferase